MATEFTVAQLKDKIQKLLRKAESTTHEEERDALTKKAEKMMLTLGIDAAELEAGGAKPEDIIEMRRDFGGNYSIVLIPFAHGLARAFGNLEILQQTYGSSLRRTLYVIGHRTDVEMFLELLDSVVLQAMSALKAWQRANREDRRGRTDQYLYLGNRSFLAGFGQECAARLREARQETVETASPGAALVLASKQEKVTAWAQQTYNPKPGKGGMRTGHGAAERDGRVAGAQANLGENKLGDSHKKL